MKRYYLILSIIPLFLFLSCSEDFNLNAPEEDVYVLNCILNNESLTQYAVISKNIYTPNGNPPSSNCIDQNIIGADLKIYCNDTVFVMRDTTIQIKESGKEIIVNCYYVNNLPLRPGIRTRIEAMIPGGKLLKSTITYVPEISWQITVDFPQSYLNIEDLPIPPGSQTEGGVILIPKYIWSWKIKNQIIKNILNKPQLEIYYRKNEGGTYVDKKKIIPVSHFPYIGYSGTLYYPDINYSFNNYCWTTLNDITKVMQEISRDDPNKNKYIINNVVFSVFGSSAELSRYYSSDNIFSNDFSVKLKSSDYSNIEGGKGIFGSYYKYSKTLKIDKLYINAFGYKYEPK